MKTLRKIPGAPDRPDRCSRLVSLCCGFALALVIAAPRADAAGPADLDFAGRLATVCQASLPDLRAAAKSFRAMGMKTVPGNAKYRTALGNDGRVMVSAAQQRNWIGCIIVVKQMTRAQARKLASRWIGQISGKPGKPRNGADVWIGAYGDKLARVEIAEIRNAVISGTGVTFEISRRLKAGTQLKY